VVFPFPGGAKNRQISYDGRSRSCIQRRTLRLRSDRKLCRLCGNPRRYLFSHHEDCRIGRSVMGNSGTTFVSYTEPVDRRRQSCKRPTRGSGMAGQEREPIPGLFRRSYRASARKYFLPSALIRSSNQEREPVQKSGVITNPSRYGAPIIPLLPVYAYLFNLFVCQCCWGVRSLAAQGG